MRSDTKQDYLQHVFTYQVPCYECLDGLGHLISHLLSGHIFRVTHDILLFGEISLKGRYMQVTSIIMGTLDEDETFSLAGCLHGVDEYILRILED
jgi:hypothetical protein